MLYFSTQLMEIRNKGDYDAFLNYQSEHPKFVAFCDDMRMYTEYSHIFYQKLLSQQNQICSSQIMFKSCLQSHAENQDIQPILTKSFYHKPELTADLTLSCNYDKKFHQNCVINKEKTQRTAFICFKCYGKKINQKGKQCTRCKGSGLISEQDQATIKSIVKEEISKCIQNAKQQLAHSSVAQPLKSTNSCTPTTINGVCVTDIPIHTLAPGEQKQQEIAFYNTGDDWPQSMAIYVVKGDKIFTGSSNIIGKIGCVAKGSTHKSILSLLSPQVAGKYNSVIQLGYSKDGKVLLIGDKVVIKIAVTEKASTEENTDNLERRGIEKKKQDICQSAIAT